VLHVDGVEVCPVEVCAVEVWAAPVCVVRVCVVRVWGSPSQHPSLNLQSGHCHVPWRHSMAALQRQQCSISVKAT
jgi:hypothetical protein